MKYTPELYAEALISSWEYAPEKNRKTLLAQFLRMLKKHGAASQIQKILEIVATTLTRKNGGNVVRLEFAREPSDKTLRTVAGFLSKKDFVKSAMNTTIGAGVRITINEEQELDYSLEHKLKQMFEHV